MKLSLAASAAMLVSAAACGQSPETAQDDYAERNDAPRETIAEAPAPQPLPAGETIAGDLQMSAPVFAGIPAFSTRTSFQLFLDDQFRGADTDANNALTESEFATASASLGTLTESLGETEIPAASEEKGDARDMTEVAERFAMISGDDNVASEQEFDAAMLAEFDVADANKDEALDEIEQKALAAKLAFMAPAGSSENL